MTPCPPDQSLAQLLSDALNPAEQAAIAQHIQACAACQKKLAQLTDNAAAAKWRRADPSASNSELEDEIVRRLKKSQRNSKPSINDPSDVTLVNFTQRDLAALAAIDSEWPAVPGYEIVGVLGRGGMAIV